VHSLNYRVPQVSLGSFTIGKQVQASDLEFILLGNPNLPDQTLNRGDDRSGLSALGNQDVWRYPQLEAQVQDGVTGSTFF